MPQNSCLNKFVPPTSTPPATPEALKKKLPLTEVFMTYIYEVHQGVSGYFKIASLCLQLLTSVLGTSLCWKKQLQQELSPQWAQKDSWKVMVHGYMVWKNFNFGKFGEKTFVKFPAVLGKQKTFQYNGPAFCKPAFSWCFLELTGLSYRYTPGSRAGHATAKKWSGSMLHVDPSLTITLQWPGMKLFQEPSLAAAASNQPVVWCIGSRDERCWEQLGCMANTLQYIESILTISHPVSKLY